MGRWVDPRHLTRRVRGLALVVLDGPIEPVRPFRFAAFRRARRIGTLMLSRPDGSRAASNPLPIR